MRQPFDNGGILPPGLAAAVNRTGQPIPLTMPASLAAQLAGGVGPVPMLEHPVTWGGAQRGGKSHTMAAARMAYDAGVPATPTAMRLILEAADVGKLTAPEPYERYQRAAYARALAEQLITPEHAITDLGRRMLAIIGGTPRRVTLSPGCIDAPEAERMFGRETLEAINAAGGPCCDAAADYDHKGWCRNSPGRPDT
jgi:hypothetical protein